MKHLIMGTAGHVDHGKTALVRALTGIECDTHPEEKRRGITINLGFAHLALPNGDTVSIIDVPGHRDFVATMVSGAAGIDFVLLVIAADSGIMPQTREHCAITQMLGVATGIIALTRIDLVDETTLVAVTEQVRAFTRGTFLDRCPIVPVSSVTMQGIGDLKATIAETEAVVRQRPAGAVFRMFIDRIFSVAGFGTVVTGSVLSGRLARDSTAFILPGDREARVRRLERHGAEVDEVVAGDRASINLVGLSREEFKRGMLVADRSLHSTTLIDVQLAVFEQSPALDLWSQVIFLSGTYEAQARLHLVDRNIAHGGELVLAQIHLPLPLVAQAGDRFVVRSSSSDITLGGGEIIDASPLHHRRRPQELVENLKKIAAGKQGELIAAEIRKHVGPVSNTYLADLLNMGPADVTRIMSDEPDAEILIYADNAVRCFVSTANRERIAGAVRKSIAARHAEHPLSAEGCSPEELLGAAGMARNSQDEGFLRLLLEEMTATGELTKVKHTFSLASHRPAPAGRSAPQIGFVESYLQKSGTRAPVVAELIAAAAAEGIDEKSVRQVLTYLVEQKKAYRVEDTWLGASMVDDARARLLTCLAANPTGLTVAQFRDLINGNRKICLLLFALFDSEKVTRRNGDVRVITEKGIAMLGSLSSRNGVGRGQAAP